ncbi:XRE family transcriptional regulator [Bosea caraganae]|uniref:XRE family transcriptional regulator n=2 Tax=Bosea caraganae TaxID=2763117 RepID=A0A370L073_9HYPH|nr:XRE family transcriptional regulator [Bosea caraganae]RDJ21225.1 XRE family transcriptional regulator [Bosea caraganae]
MRMRSELMMSLDDLIKKKAWTQAEAARHLGITQPRVSELVNGKIQLFSLDQLMTLLARAGYRVEMKVKKIRAQKRAA